jgi:hypothetical protein
MVLTSYLEVKQDTNAYINTLASFSLFRQKFYDGLYPSFALSLKAVDERVLFLFHTWTILGLYLDSENYYHDSGFTNVRSVALGKC